MATEYAAPPGERGYRQPEVDVPTLARRAPDLLCDPLLVGLSSRLGTT